MELLQLKYFHESALSGSFSHTAAKYKVPVTSVSASVKRLEAELGVKLFERSANRIFLNEKGLHFKQSLDIVFSELNSAITNLTAPEDTREIRMLVKAARNRITNAITEYKKQHPRISFITIFDFAEKDNEDYHIIIDDNPQYGSEYESFVISDVPIRLKASETLSLHGKPLSLASLKNIPFVSMGESSNMHKILVKACAKAGFTPKIAVSANDILCYRKCLESGIGIGYGREDFSELPEGTRFLEVTDFNERQVVSAYFKPGNAYGNVAHFLSYLSKKGKK